MLRKILPLFLLLPMLLSASCIFPIVYVMNGRVWRASGNFSHAMEAGDGRKAIYWAKRVSYLNKPHYDSWTDKVLHRNPREPYHLFNGEMYLAEAYEMNGEIEKAWTLFQDLARRGRAEDASFTKARILYKLHCKKESFTTYCHACQDLIAKWERSGNNFSLTDSLLNHVFPYSLLKNENLELRRRFCNFADIHEFYLFMNAEYEKQNRPEQYAKVMERLREIDQRRDEIMKEYRREPAPVTTNTR